jgi:uncharacterized protein
MDNKQYKRNIAYKLRVGDIQAGKVVIEEEKFKQLELGDKHVVKINLVANITDKYIQDGEKKFASITLDDATGQIKAKVFGDDIEKFAELNQGDTVVVMGNLRHWNNELYITPDIIKKKDPVYLLVRKFEVESEKPKMIGKEELSALKDKVISMVKDAEKDNGIEIEKIIMELKEHPDVINSEIRKLLEEGMIYEPRPGKIRYLG